MVSQNLIGCAAVTSALIAALSIRLTRNYIVDYYNSSLFAALSVYLFIFLFSAAILVLLSGREWRHGGAHGLLNHNEMTLSKSKVESAIDYYNSNYSQTTRTGDGTHDAKLSQRQQNYMTLVNNFYDLVTDFYEVSLNNYNQYLVEASNHALTTVTETSESSSGNLLSSDTLVTCIW